MKVYLDDKYYIKDYTDCIGLCYDKKSKGELKAVGIGFYRSLDHLLRGYQAIRERQSNAKDLDELILCLKGIESAIYSFKNQELPKMEVEA